MPSLPKADSLHCGSRVFGGIKKSESVFPALCLSQYSQFYSEPLQKMGIAVFPLSVVDHIKLLN